MNIYSFIEKITKLIDAGAPFGFAFKGFVDWISSGDDEYERRRNKGKIYFFGGIAVIILACGIVFILNNTEIAETSTSSLEGNLPDVSSSPAQENLTSNSSEYFIEDMQCVGATYTGYIDRQTQNPNGQGTMTYYTGDEYNGNWVQGIREGYGEMKYYNGDKYKGEWSNDKKNGSGIYTWSDGRNYVGEYKNDQRNGQGTYTGWTGYLDTYGWTGNYTGFSKDDKFEGQGTFEFECGDKFEGIFTSDKFWNGTYTRRDGSKYEIIGGEPSE